MYSVRSIYGHTSFTIAKIKGTICHWKLKSLKNCFISPNILFIVNWLMILLVIKCPLISLWNTCLLWMVDYHMDYCTSFPLLKPRNYSLPNENLNLLVCINFLNLFLYSYKYKLENLQVRTSFTGLGPKYQCSLWGLIYILPIISFLHFFVFTLYFGISFFYEFEIIIKKKKIKTFASLTCHKLPCNCHVTQIILI
jgi:hypothetical protein